MAPPPATLETPLKIDPNQSSEAKRPAPSDDPRRRLPAVDVLVRSAAPLTGTYGVREITVQARLTLESLRTRGDLGAGEVEMEALVRRLSRDLERRLEQPLRRVVNATGVFLHTNLGRAPLPHDVALTLAPLLDAACNVEFDLESGQRGDRNRRVGALLAALTGADAALVVNNNAAAMMLVLATLARDREVIVSRGELVEIGGSFRIPDILSAAGARLIEVGTTNRTRLQDYEAAVTERTALLLKVFPSNFRIKGFTQSVSASELAGLGRRLEVITLVDEGSGLLQPSEHSALLDHPSSSELLASGCDLVCGSGDKLLGGPQSGLLLGSREVIDRCRRHPLYRAVRTSRLVLCALEGVLQFHLRKQPLPLDRLFVDPSQHRLRLERCVGRWNEEASLPRMSIKRGSAYIGGGSAPDRALPGEVLALPGSQSLCQRLRNAETPVVGRLRHGDLLLDLRTVDPLDDSRVIDVLIRCWRDAEAGE